MQDLVETSRLGLPGQIELRTAFYRAITGEEPPEGGMPAELAMPVGRGLHEGTWNFKLRSGQTFKASNYFEYFDFLSQNNP